ncbi:phage major capsid protein [Candidatus Parcubacteria bacterium]|nr:MAG: phage major capsid protein [Candidatus Parcubacteria bacterium]
MREKAAALLDEDAGIRAAAVNQKRQLTGQEQDRITQIYNEVEELEASIKLEEKGEAIRARFNQSVDEPARPDPTDDGNGSYRAPGAANRPKPRKGDGFRTLGEFLTKVAIAQSPGGLTDPRLIQAAATGMSEGVFSDGGFAVGTDIAGTIMDKIFGAENLASRCTRFTISNTSNSIKVPRIVESSRADGSRWGGVRGYWKDEAAAMTASKPKGGDCQLSLENLTVLIYTTDQLLADSAALESYIRQLAPKEIIFKMNDALINGDGSGKPLGILQAGCLVSQAKETGQTAETIKYENIVKMWSRMFSDSRPNAVWLINQDVEPQLYTMSLAVGTGGSAVYLPPGGASDQPYARLFGRPVIPMEQCPTLGTVGDIILADFSQYLLADKGGVESASSIHVQFLYNETVFRFVYRVDGQPWWGAPLTPKSGSSNTLSPFVALATRS